MANPKSRGLSDVRVIGGGLQFFCDSLGAWLDASEVKYSERGEAWQLAFGDAEMPKGWDAIHAALCAATSFEIPTVRVEDYAPTPNVQSSASSGPIEDAIRTIVEPMVKAAASQLDPEAIAKVVDAEVQKRLESLRPKVTAITYRDRPTVELPEGSAHVKLPQVLALVNKGKLPWLVGPAGSGKSTLARNVAEVLELPFYAVGCNPMMSTSALYGFVSAMGELVRTDFREAYENGGVFLLDEMDAANPGVLTAFNDALANGQAGFPDGMVKRHPDFVCIVGANTFGRGSDRQYVGRCQLDAATTNRFKMLPVDYDEKLEARLAAAHNPQLADAWLKVIHKIRANAAEAGIRCVVSTRSVMDCDLLDDFSPEEVLDMSVFQGIASDQREKMMRGVKLDTLVAA